MAQLVNNWETYKTNKPPTTETANDPSLTVPDQTLSIKELIARHKSGRNVTVLTGSYQESGEYDELLAHVQGMSEIERIEYAQTLKEEVRIGLEAYEKDTKNREKRQAKAAKDADAAKLAASEEARLKLKDETDKNVE